MRSHPVNPNSVLPSLLFQRLRWRILVLSVSLIAAIFGILAPYAQKRFIDALIHATPAMKWVWIAFFLMLSAQLFTQLSLWLSVRESAYSQKALSELLYGRMLAVPGGLMGRRPAGEAVSLFAVDVPGAAAILDQSLVMVSAMVFPILLAPIALHKFYGIPWRWSLAAIVAMAGVNYVLASRQSRFFYRFKALAAERTGLVSEWVQNIRTLRILGWVSSAEARIFQLRRKETRNRKTMVTNGQVMNSLAGSLTFFFNLLAVTALVHLRGGNVTPGEILSLLWILGVFLARPLRQFPWLFVISMDAISSGKRLEHSLQLENGIAMVAQAPNEPGTFPGALPPALEVVGLDLEIGSQKLLKNIHLRIGERELVGIVGEVGSGKSLLLQSLIGEAPARFRSFAVGGRSTSGPSDPIVRSKFAYLSQEGFTMSATLRENVVFEYSENSVSSALDPAEAARVHASLKFSQFAPEDERLDHGMETEIGERGVNLSGGQRQRVGLARAHFADRPVLLLDDCLSAVDVGTERRLVRELIKGAWKDRARLLVTHRMSVLPHCDRIIFLENGEIALQGRYEDLLASSEKFRRFVQRTEQEQKAKEAEAHV